ncbi:hypothetical protein [Bacillus wiedmannii]|uniref:hypothetical protein n=1 Tax=Bacillus wiedmannii TaxID=1890302 RepID=UPI003F8E9DF3
MDIDGESALYEQVNFAIALFIKAGLTFDGIDSCIVTIKARKLVEQAPSEITERFLKQLAKERMEKKAGEIKKELLIKHNADSLQKLRKVDKKYSAHVTGMVLSKVNDTDFSRHLQIIDGNELVTLIFKYGLENEIALN